MTAHPEETCQRCHNQNVYSWHAPSPLWNAVMRDKETGTDVYSVVCPTCFSRLVEEAGIGSFTADGASRTIWCFKPHNLKVETLWIDPDGRVWDSSECLWMPD